MTLQTLFDSENDVLAQNREIGIPTSDELHKSSNVIWIESYTKDDGTEVKGHWRSLPDGEYTGGTSIKMKIKSHYFHLHFSQQPAEHLMLYNHFPIANCCFLRNKEVI